MSGLREGFDVNVANGRVPGIVDEATAAGMGSLRRGWESGRITNELNPLQTEALDAELAGNQPLAQSLRGQIDNLQQRQAAYAPAVGRVEDIHGVGDGLDWAAGQVGQGVASMVDPMAVSAGLGVAGRVAGAIPHPLARGAGLALQGAALGVPYLMSKKQLTGEFIGNARQDPALMARTSPQTLRDMAGTYGALAAIPDSALPGIVGRQVSGLSRAGSAVARHSAMGPVAKTLMELAGEGSTEALQSAGSQYARGILNPERDTSGDFMENVNNFAGGAVGAGPFAAGGSFAEAGHNRVGAGVDAVKDAAGSVVDLMGNSAPVQAGKKAFGATKDGVVDLMAGQDGKVTPESVVENLKAGTVDMGSRVQNAINERNILNEIPPADVAADDAKTAQWLNQNRAARHQLVVDKLAAMPEGDPEVQHHLEAAVAEYPDAQTQDQAVSAAARFILERSPIGRAEERANALGESLGKIAGVVGPAIGKGAVAAGKAALGFGKSVVNGAQEGMRKKNAQAAPEQEQESFSSWRDRVYGTQGRAVADQALKQGESYNKAADFNQRAELAGNYTADVAARSKLSRNMQALARQSAFNLADAVDDPKLDIPTKVNRLNRLVSDFHAAYRGNAPEVLKQLGAILGPQAGPAVQHMLGQLEQQMSPQGPRIEAEARDALGAQVVSLIDPTAQNRLMVQGVNLNTPRGREQTLHMMEDFADGISTKPGLRQALEGTFGADSVKNILELLNGQKEEAPTDVAQAEPLSEHEQRAADKLVVKGTGPKVFGFHSTANLRTQDDGRDMFAPTEKSKPGEDSTPKRPNLFKKGQQLSGGKGDAIEKKIADMRRQLQEDPAYPDHDNYRVEARSAHDVMKDAGMQPGKVLQIYRDYMRMEYNDEKNPPEQKRYFAQQMRVANNMIKDGEYGSLGRNGPMTAEQLKGSGIHVKKGSFKTTPLEREELSAAAEAYFKERYVVVGEQLSNQDPSKITLPEVLAMHKEGQGLIERSRLAEDRAAALSDANILMFKSDAVKGGELAIPAGKLVKWVKESRGKSAVANAEDTSGSHSNRSKDEAYLADVMEGIAALIGSGRVKGLPYKINQFGEAENFTQGVPDSLRLATKSYGAMKFGEQTRREGQTPKTAAELAPSTETQEKVAAEQTVEKPDTTEGSIDDAHPEIGKAKTDDDSMAPLDFSKAPKDGVPDEYAAQRWLSRQTGASTDAVPGPESKGTAVSSAEHRAEAITAAFLNDPAKGQEMIRSRIRSAMRPEYSADKNAAVGGVHYIAPVAAFASAKNLTKNNVDLPAKTIQAIQAKVANILLKGDVSDIERIKIARLLVAGTDEKISAFNVKAVLQRIADGVATQGKPIAAKQETRAETTLGKAIAKRQEYLDNPPAGYTSEQAKAVADWAKGQLARVVAEKSDDADRQDQLSDYKAALMTLQKKAASVLEGDASLAGFEGTSAPEVAKAGLPKGQPTPSGGRKLNAQSGDVAPSSKPKLITRLADDRKARFANDPRTGVFRSGRGTDTFGPLKDGFAYYHTSDSGHTYTAVVPAEFVPRLEAYLKTAPAEKEANALAFFGAQFLVYDTTTGDVHTFAPAEASPVHLFLSEFGVLEKANTTATMPDGSPIMRIRGVTDLETAKFLATSLAYSKHVLGEDEVFINWKRITGANEGKEGSGWFNAQPGADRVSTQAERDEAVAYARKVLGPKISVAFKDITGYSGEFIDAQNAIEISTTAAAGTLGTLYHEAMHVFFRDFVKSHPKMQAVFESLINDPKHLAKLTALLDGYPAAQAQLVSGEERLAYTYQFWKAGLLEVDTKAHTWLQKLGKFFRTVLGTVRDSERALELFQAFDNGKMSEPSAAGMVIAKAMERGTAGLKMRRKMDALFQGLAALTFPSAEILGRSVSPTARKLSTMFFTNPGEEAHGKEATGLLNARRNVAQQYTNMSNRHFESMSETDQAAVQKYLQSETALADIPYSEHREVVKSVRDLLDRFHQYMTDAGMKIGKVENYYPTVWNTQVLSAKKQAFTDMLVSKYAKELSPINGDVRQAAERIWQSLVDKEGVDAHLPASREDGVLAPFFASQEMRTLPWLKGVDKEAYLEKDMPLTLARYFSQGAHAAEYFRRFGENGKRLEKMLADINVELSGASKEMLRRGEFEDEAARVAWVGRQMRDVTQATGAMEGSLGKDVSPNMRKFNSWMTTYQNIRLLPMALFSSFVDPLAMVARGAPLQAAYETFTYGMREVFRGWADAFKDMPPQRQKDEWRKLAEAIGASETAVFSKLVSDQYSSTYMTPGAKRINDKMFMFNGMEAWNRANRIMATKWAVRFIEQNAALPDRHHSARWLAELGLTPAMITKDAQGNLITNRHELAAAKGISLEQATKEIAPIHDAINRWVEGAVLTPNAAQRPSWSSNPNYASAFHLKQFSYSFHQTILKRATNEFKHGNMAPLGALALFVPTMIGADIMKGLIQGAGTLPPYMAGMNAGDWVAHGVQRAGLSGIGVIGMDAATDWASLGGPAFEQIVDAARDGFGSSTVMKALPLHALYGELAR